jgi:hypothetical protein
MNQLHPIEAAWRQFRGGQHSDLMQRSFADMPNFLKLFGLKRLPAEVILPPSIPGTLVPVTSALGNPWMEEQVSLIIGETTHVWAAYRESKNIYRVETALAECFARTPWPDDAPTQSLRLPSRCAVLELPWKGQLHYVAALYNLAGGAESAGQIEITLHLFF